MIFTQTKLFASDNSGAKLLHVIGIAGPKKVGTIGSLLTVSIKSIKSGSTSGPNTQAKVKPGEVHKALLVRTKKPTMRPDGRLVRFDDNAAVLLLPDGNPMGTRVIGPVGQELRQSGKWTKILSLASKIL